MLQPKIVKVTALQNMKLLLTYETGETKLFDVSPYANGSWYGKLRDTSYFNSVRILPEGKGIEWPEGQDISPHELYESGIAVRNDEKRIMSLT